jgi:hypothetical protein
MIVILDIGSHIASFGDYSSSMCSDIPSIIGKDISNQIMVGFGHKDIYVGHEIYQKTSHLEIYNTVHNHFLVRNDTDQPAVEHVLHHIFYNEFRTDPAETTMIFAEHPLLSDKDKVTLFDLFFSSFSFHSIIPLNSLWLQLLGVGFSSGYIINFGHYQTNMAYFEDVGGILYEPKMKSYQEINIGGENLSQFMCQVAMENGVKFTFQDSFGIGLRSMCRFASTMKKRGNP